jgi:hypothetical protein
MTTIYLSDREVGIQWDGRGAIQMIDRQGNVSERFTPPQGSTVVYPDTYEDE